MKRSMLLILLLLAGLYMIVGGVFYDIENKFFEAEPVISESDSGVEDLSDRSDETTAQSSYFENSSSDI